MIDFNTQRELLASNFGIHLPQVTHFLEKSDYIALDRKYALDAQPTLVTQPNSAVPAYFLNYTDPKVIEVLVTPNDAVKVCGTEIKIGDWVTETSQFPLAESTGETSSYGDYSNSGMSNANVNWVPRQAYLYQTITRWGERELARYSEAKINWAQRLVISSAMTLDKFQNNIYFYGVANLQNFGLLTDPSLPASITPLVVGGQTQWSFKDGQGVYNDIQALYNQLVSQTNGLVNTKSPLVLALSPTSEANFTKTNSFNVNTNDQIRKNFPNLRIETAVQYGLLAAGSLVQMFAEELEGQRTVECAFNEKMRAGPVIQAMSSWEQKKTAGAWGAIVKMPIAIASMIGV